VGDVVRDPTILTGPELMAGLDPDDPEQATLIADIQSLLEATSADIDQFTMLNASSVDGQDFVGAVRVTGADPETIRSAYVETTAAGLAEPRIKEGQIAGHAVTRIYDDAEPDLPGLIIYASGDTIWVIKGSDETARAVIESFP
jgi:hypothetical protein